MRKLGAWVAAVVMLVSASIVACHKSKQDEQLAALDDGLKSGLLTKDEYDRRRARVLMTRADPPAAPAPVAAPVPAPPPENVPAPVTADKPAVSTPVVPKSKPSPVTPAPAAPEPVKPEREPPAAGTPKPSSGEDAAEPAPVAGCTDVGTRPGKEKGEQERFFPMPIANVKAAAIHALAVLEFKVTRNTGQEIEASRKRHIGVLIGSGGEKMLLRFEAAQEGRQHGTRVIGETKKGLLMRAGQKSWTNAVLAQTGCILRQDPSGH